MKKMLNEIKDNKNELLIAALVIYIFSLCFSWAVTTPYNSAPDESMKYDICKYIAYNSKLPHGTDEAIRDPRYGTSYGFSPMLSYIIGGYFMKIVLLFNLSSEHLFWAARFTSVLTITAYAVIVLIISNKLFEGSYKILFIVFSTMLPQLIYLGSYINNDSLAILSSSIIIYSWIIGLKSDWDWKSCIIMGIGIGLCAMAYYNAYGYILCSIILYCLSCFKKKIKFKEFFKKGTLISIIALSIAGWWFVRSYIIYDGDILGRNAARNLSEQYGIRGYKPSHILTPKKVGKSLWFMLAKMKWIKTSLNSFIGVFEWMSMTMMPIDYLIYYIIGAIGILGILSKLLIMIISNIKQKMNKFTKNKKEDENNIGKLFNIIMVVVMIIPIVLSIQYSYNNDYQPQGRYLMPMIIPFMYFLVKGYQYLIEEIWKNEKVKEILFTVIITTMVLMPISIYFRFIIFVQELIL